MTRDETGILLLFPFYCVSWLDHPFPLERRITLHTVFPPVFVYRMETTFSTVLSTSSLNKVSPILHSVQVDGPFVTLRPVVYASLRYTSSIGLFRVFLSHVLRVGQVHPPIPYT